MARTYTVSSQSELMSALSSASGGDTILLESGNYGSVDFKNLSFSSYVTLSSADGKNGAVFSDIGVYNSSYLRIDGVHVSNPGNGSSASKLVTIQDGSHHVEFLNSEVNGKVDGVYNGHYGIYTSGSQHVTVSGNHIHDVKNGFIAFSSSNLTVSGNTLDYLGEDAFKFGGVTDFVIENNSQIGPVFREAGAHLDFMQFQGSASDGVIRGNVFLAQNVANVQGIFLDDYTFNNILIEQNIIYTGMANGIKIENGSGNIVRDNTVLNAPDLVHKATYISVPSGTVVQNNITASYEGRLSGSNLTAQHDDTSDIYHYDTLFENATKGLGITLEDLRPIAGSAAEGRGAYERIMELLP